MATMIPHLDNAYDLESESDAEKILYELLRDHLPGEYLVVHSQHLLLPPREKKGRAYGAREIESDFVIAHPEHGLLAIEVKGGPISYKGHDQQWYSAANAIEDPFRQAQGGIHSLIEVLQEKGIAPERIDFTYGSGVAFPDVEIGTIDLPPHCRRELIIDSASLENLEKSITAIFNFWRANRIPAHGPLGKHRLARVEGEILAPSLGLASSLGAVLRQERSRFLKLTEEQRTCLAFLDRNGSCVIEGPAGTGKSVIGMEFARAEAVRGHRVLVLCYNRVLGSAIREVVKGMTGLKGEVWAGCYEELCASWAKAAGLDLGDKPDSASRTWADYFTVASLQLMEAATRQEDLFDTIIVDEGQDMDPEWWGVIESLWRGGKRGKFLILSDPLQNLYHRPLKYPQGLPTFPLSRNCRNTHAIAQYAATAVDAHLSGLPGVRGERPREIQCTSCDQVCANVDAIVRQLAKDGVRPDQIIILSPRRKENSSLKSVDQLAGLPLDILEPSSVVPPRGRLQFSTVHSFKGLERDVAVLIDLDRNSKHFSPNQLYVAASRAQFRLFVITCPHRGADAHD